MLRVQQKGFTLVELIVVIAIVGILAAVAVPRFISQTQSARVAALNGLAGAIHSAISLAQAQYIAELNSSNSTATSISMNGTAVTVVAGTGRPAASDAGIKTALATLNGFVVSYNTTLATFNFTTTITDCNVVYDSSDGSVSVTTSGC